MLLTLLLASGSIIVSRTTGEVVARNGLVELRVDLKRGDYQLAFKQGPQIESVGAVARLPNGSPLSTKGYQLHQLSESDVKRISDAFGKGVQITVHNRTINKPELRQTFWLYEGRNEAFVQVELVGRESVATNYLAPIQTVRPFRIAVHRQLNSLFVPYDNDAYSHYRTDAWVKHPDDQGSNEVGAVFDDGSRRGLVVGSVDHDLWKSGIRVRKSLDGAVSELTAYAGARGPSSQTRIPHGVVSGKTIRSPRFVIGWYPDWRDGLERYGRLNSVVKPPLPWSGPVPFGWNSWAGHKNELHASDATTSVNFLAEKLPELRSGGTAYVDLDSYWDNLSDAQLGEFVDLAHRRGLKAGIYWSPFTGWGELKSSVAGDDRYVYRDLVLKDQTGNPFPRSSGGYPLDPTHPGTKARIDRQLAKFVSQRFDFIKLDFLTHGALEGRHFDPTVQTGTAAYRLGMQRIVNDLSPQKIGRPFFISISIAPLFPQGYAHSRRISCDAFANIVASEYLLNSASYGWWTNRTLYDFNDPDSTCVYQPLHEKAVSEAEAQTRFTASVVSGGMMFEGDNLTLSPARTRVEKLFTNTEVLNLARKCLAFRPVNSVASDKSASCFYARDPNSRDIYFAAFNYSKKAQKLIRVPMIRLEVSPGPMKVFDLWSGSERTITRVMKLNLMPMSCVLWRLRS